METDRGEAGENLGSDIATSDVEKVWYRRSHLSSTLYAVDASGDVAFHLQYDEWGAPETDTQARQNHAGIDNLNNFTGYTYDEVLGIYFAQNRFYDPELRRFTQEDPVRSGMNWFAYVGNNPINNTDPWGLYDPDQPTYDYYEDINTLVAEAGGKITYMGGLTGWQGYKVQVNGYYFEVQTDDHNIDYDSILKVTASNGTKNITIRHKIQNVWFGRDPVQLFAYDFNQLLGGGSSKGQGGAGRGGSNDNPPTTVTPVPTPKPEDGGYQEQLGGEYKAYLTLEQLNALGWTKIHCGYTDVSTGLDSPLTDMDSVITRRERDLTQEDVDKINFLFEKYEINTQQRIAAFFAQSSAETTNASRFLEAAGTDRHPFVGDVTRENLNRWFDEYTEYGAKYRGGGAIQLTWNYHYIQFEEWMKTEFSIIDPNITALGSEYVAMNYTFESTVFYWVKNDLNAQADTGNIDNVSKIVNSGMSSKEYQLRRDYYNQWMNNYNFPF